MKAITLVLTVLAVMFGTSVLAQNTDMDNFLSVAMGNLKKVPMSTDTASDMAYGGSSAIELRFMFAKIEGHKSSYKKYRGSHKRRRSSTPEFFHGELSPLVSFSRLHSDPAYSQISEARNISARGGLQFNSEANIMLWIEAGYNYNKIEYFQKKGQIYTDVKTDFPELAIGFTLHNWFLPFRWKNQLTMRQGYKPEFLTDFCVMFNRDNNVSPFFGYRSVSGNYYNNYCTQNLIYGGLDLGGLISGSLEYNPGTKYIGLKAVFHLSIDGSSSNYNSGSGCEAYKARR